MALCSGLCYMLLNCPDLEIAWAIEPVLRDQLSAKGKPGLATSRMQDLWKTLYHIHIQASSLVELIILFKIMLIFKKTLFWEYSLKHSVQSRNKLGICFF